MTTLKLLTTKKETCQVALNRLGAKCRLIWSARPERPADASKIGMWLFAKNPSSLINQHQDKTRQAVSRPCSRASVLCCVHVLLVLHACGAASAARAAADPGSQIQAQSKDTNDTFPSPLALRPLTAYAPSLMNAITTTEPATGCLPSRNALSIPASPETITQSGELGAAFLTAHLLPPCANPTRLALSLVHDLLRARSNACVLYCSRVGAALLPRAFPV